MCEHSRRPKLTSGDATLSQVVSLAKTSATRESERELTENEAVCGRNLPGLFAWYDQDTCSWRTSQPSPVGGSTEFSGTWPRSGMMRNGIACRRKSSGCPTGGLDFSLWPTPHKNLAMDTKFSKEQNVRRLRRNQQNGYQNGPAGGSLTDRVIDELGVFPSVDFVKMMMDFPSEFTLLEL